MKHGEGTYVWSNGQTFTGTFVADKTADEQTPNFDYFEQYGSPQPHSKRSSKDQKIPKSSSKDRFKKH